MKVISTLVLITFVFEHCIAQNQETTVKTEEENRIDEALNHFNKKPNPDNLKALELIGDLESHFEKEKNWQYWMQCMRMKFVASIRIPSMDSYRLIEKSKHALNELPPIYKARYHNNLSYIYLKKGPIYKAKEHAAHALKLYKDEGDKKLELSMLNRLAACYSTFNDHQSAINYEKIYQNLIEQEAYYGTLSPKVLKRYKNRSHKNLAQYYYHAGAAKNSLVEIEKSLAFDTTYSKLIYKVNALLALSKNEAANKIIKSFGPPTNLNANLQVGLADVFESQGKGNEALELRRIAFNNTAPSRDRNYLKNAEKFANALYKNKEDEKALKLCHQIIQSFCIGYENEDIYSLPESKMLIPEAYLMEALNLKAKILEDLYQEGNENITIDLVFDTYNLSIETLDLLRTLYEESNSKFLMNETMHNIYLRPIKFALAIQKNQKSDQYLSKAFTYIQASKAFGLRESISKRQAFKLAQVPDELISNYFSLSSRSFDVGQDYLVLKDSLSMLEKNIQNEYPMVGELIKNEFISIKEVQAKLTNNQAILDYYVNADELVCIVITKQEKFIYEKKLADSFFESINTYTALLHDPAYNPTNSKSDVFLQHSKKIKDAVLTEILAKLKVHQIDQLTIVGSGIINKIAFANLPLGDKSPWSDYKESLLMNYSFNYLHYVNQLNNKLNNKIRKSLCIGLDYSQRKQSETNSIKLRGNIQLDSLYLNQLPNAKKEAIEIAQRLNTKALIDGRANLKNIKRGIRSSDHIHFAGHCIIDVDDYKNSFIPVYDNSGKIEVLGYDDIQSMNINPALVVLSACNTNNGKALNSEGMFSMSRVFTETGASSVLGSNWNTPDKPALKITGLFYDNLLTGMNKAEALRQAQLTYLMNDEYSNPNSRVINNWSNWSIYGLDNPVEFEAESRLQKLMVPILMALVSFGFLLTLLIKHKKKTNPTSSF